MSHANKDNDRPKKDGRKSKITKLPRRILDASLYRISFRAERPLVPVEPSDPGDYWFSVQGEIEHFDDDEVPQGTVGWISARVVQIGRAMNDKIDLAEVADSEDQNLHDYCAAFTNLERGAGLREDLAEVLAGSNLLIVERIEILPEHRGARLGHLAMLRTIDTFGEGCAFVAIQPMPLQFNETRGGDKEWAKRMDFAKFKSDEATSLKKLESHWSALGFEPLKDSKFFFLDLSFDRPSASDFASG